MANDPVSNTDRSSTPSPAQTVDADATTRTRTALSGSTSPSPQTATPDDRAASQARMQAEGQVAQNRTTPEPPNWRGFPAGMSEAEFNAAYDQRTRETGRPERPAAGLLEAAGYGAKMAFDFVSSGFDRQDMLQELYVDDRSRAFKEYELVTGGRDASKWESFSGGVGQGITLGFGDELSAGAASALGNRSYADEVASRRTVNNEERADNPKTFVAGEITGGVATVAVPGGAATNVARATTTVGAMRAGATSGAIYGAVAGAGYDEGGVVDRLDGAATGAVTGAAIGAVTGPLAHRLTGGGKISNLGPRADAPPPASLSNKAAREWYLNQEKLIPSRLDRSMPLEGQARQAHAIRNEARTVAREIMEDRALAEKLTRENPNLTWDQLVAKTQAKGFEGDEVFEQIIDSSQRSRKSVNERLGLD